MKADRAISHYERCMRCSVVNGHAETCSIPALERSRERLNGKASTAPVFADVLVGGARVGHIVNNGYGEDLWAFYPSDTSRRGTPRFKRLAFHDVVPKWVGPRFKFGPFLMQHEFPEAVAKKAEQDRLDKEERASAKVMAAAPDLLAALELFVNEMARTDDADDLPAACKVAEAAIAKARGKSA